MGKKCFMGIKAMIIEECVKIIASDVGEKKGEDFGGKERNRESER